MTQRIINLRDLLIEQGRELYNISVQEQKELPEIKRRAKDPKLKEAIDREIQASRDHKERLERAFGEMNIELGEEKNESFSAIMKKAKGMMDRSEDFQVRDAAIINAVQRLNHSKITGFGSMSSYANEIGENFLANSFHNSLEVEKAIDETLSNLAMGEINPKAVDLRRKK